MLNNFCYRLKCVQSQWICLLFSIVQILEHSDAKNSQFIADPRDFDIHFIQTICATCDFVSLILIDFITLCSLIRESLFNLHWLFIGFNSNWRYSVWKLSTFSALRMTKTVRICRRIYFYPQNISLILKLTKWFSRM